MKFILGTLLVLMGMHAGAQVQKVSLEASGLTCSMCSKAVKEALEAVPFVAKVQVDIKNQQYHISFDPDGTIDFDALALAVTDAGFSVSKFKVTANLEAVQLEKDQHIQVGNTVIHFLNASGQHISGTTSFSIVDKDFVPAKEFRKVSELSKMGCVQTGKAAACCTKDSQTRIYHAMI